MARIDYYSIEQELQAILQGAPSLDGVNVVVEAEATLSDNTPCLAIYIEKRTPDSAQSLSAGTRQRYQLRISIWAWVFGLEMPQILRQRDDLVSDLELVLLGQQDRTINGMVETYWLEGGEMLSARRPETMGLIVGAETILTAVVTAY